ncbi:14937_t:CDS:1, partial [Dentiscutata heterogama]
AFSYALFPMKTFRIRSKIVIHRCRERGSMAKLLERPFENSINCTFPSQG